MTNDHYENFPVASWLVPARLRPALVALYRFAREADDIADEGERSDEERRAALVRGDQIEHDLCRLTTRSARADDRQNLTVGGCWAAGSASKYSRLARPIMRAKISDGKVWIALLKPSTESL